MRVAVENHALPVYNKKKRIASFLCIFESTIRGDAQNVVTAWFFMKKCQNDVTQVKLFIMTEKLLLDVQNTNNSEFGCY